MTGSGETRWLATAFGLDQPDLVYRTVFPILIGNLVRSLNRASDLASASLPGRGGDRPCDPGRYRGIGDGNPTAPERRTGGLALPWTSWISCSRRRAGPCSNGGFSTGGSPNEPDLPPAVVSDPAAARRTVPPLAPAVPDRSFPTRLRWSTLLRSAIFGLLVLAVADPRLLLERNRSHLVFVADASASMEREALGRIGDWYDLAESIFPLPRSVRRGGGNGGAAGGRLRRPAPGAIDPSRTRIGRLCASPPPPSPPGARRRWSCSATAAASDADPGTSVDEAWRRSARPHGARRAPRPARDPRALRPDPSEAGPQRTHSGRGRRSPRRAATVELALFRNGAARPGKASPSSRAPTASLTSNAPAAEGIIEITAEMRPAGVWTPSSTTTGWPPTCAPCDRSRVLLLSDRPESARYLSRALRQEGFRLDIRPPTGCPPLPAGLEDFDLVVFDNIPATDPSADQTGLTAQLRPRFRRAAS